MATPIHSLPQATGHKCEPPKEPLTASSSKFSANFSVPQILVPSQLSVFFLAISSRQPVPSQKYAWRGFNRMGQTTILTRSLRVLIPGSHTHVSGGSVPERVLQLGPALAVALTGSSASGASCRLPKGPP